MGDRTIAGIPGLVTPSVGGFPGLAGIIGAGGIIPPPPGENDVLAIKSADTARAAATPSDDPELAGLAVTSGLSYALEAWLMVTSGGTAPDFRFHFSTLTTTFCGGLWWVHEAGVSSFQGVIGGGRITALDDDRNCNTSTNFSLVRFGGAFEAGATTTIALQWAGNSGAGSTTLLIGSYLRLTELV